MPVVNTNQPESERGYDPTTRQAILALAKDAVAADLHGQPLTAPPDDCPPALLEHRGCFVTLHNGHRLRGCIGTFDEDKPLADNLITMAAAATRDPRFVDDSITLDELNHLSIDVSVLTPRTPVDPSDYVLGLDGIYITGKRFGQQVGGCFLPEVAPEQGWDLDTTLSMLCAHKMGLSHDAWKPPTKLQFYRFRSIKVSEHDQ